jgi:formate-dependent phosphoribosylglycinamide formyltransferase (GAR transformylase)
MSGRSPRDRAIEAIAGFEVDYMALDKDEAADIVDRLEAAGLQIVPAAKPACATAARDDLTRRIGEES